MKPKVKVDEVDKAAQEHFAPAKAPESVSMGEIYKPVLGHRLHKPSVTGDVPVAKE